MLLEELLDSGFRVEDAERLRDLLTVGCTFLLRLPQFRD